MYVVLALGFQLFLKGKTSVPTRGLRSLWSSRESGRH